MNKLLFLCLVSGIILVLTILIYYYALQPKVVSKDVVLYFRINDKLEYQNKSLSLNQAMTDVLVNSEPAQVYDQTHFFLFETLNNIDQLMVKVRFPLFVRHIYGLHGTDFLASKSALAMFIKSKLNKSTAGNIIPNTYVVGDTQDMKDLTIRMYNNGSTPADRQVYILKKNVQRQEGHHITNKVNEVARIIEDPSSEYVVVQEMLQNPLIVGGRKVNMRIYMLITCKENVTRFYVYKNGFMYYTPKFFKKNSIDKDEVVTTGYIDRKVYEENPLTLYDLEKALGSVHYPKIFDGIKEITGHLKHIYSSQLSYMNRKFPGTKFLIFGCDYAPDSDYGVKLIEINKGPDLSYKDERDKQVKFNLVRDVFKEVGILGRKDNDVSDLIEI